MKHRWLGLFVVPFLLAVFSAAVAQDYPTRAVRIIVPFPPGGAADVLARLLAQSLSEQNAGKSFLVESRAGGNTIIAANVVAKSAPDGHTLLMPVDSTLTMNKSLFAQLPYDPVKDFAPITLLAEQPLLLSANPRAPLFAIRPLA
jgi:tripartite-type tricarboxylate transporter receptor subunit TctC